jgi:hypothetical protein
MGKSGSEGRGEQTTARERGIGGSPLTLLPKPQSPEDESEGPPERHPIPAPGSATASPPCRRNLRSVERCPVRAIKEMNGTPKSRSDVQQGRTRDRLQGASPKATEGP